MIHVLPIDDLEEHTEASTCKCSPRAEKAEDDIIVIHNSFDGREAIEWTESILEKRDGNNN